MTQQVLQKVGVIAPILSVHMPYIKDGLSFIIIAPWSRDEKMVNALCQF